MGTVNWLFGRGISIACGLTWDVPKAWENFAREEIIEKIKVELKVEMGNAKINKKPIKSLLNNLSNRTEVDWHHRFITTNWDYLVQEAVTDLNLEMAPRWLPNTHVFHLNGSIESFGNPSLRSQILLTNDPPQIRIPKYETDKVFNQMIWDRVFYVVGMSFECDMDQYLLQSFKKVEDDMPIGEAFWFVINPDKAVLDASSLRIKRALPRARVFKAPITLERWIESGMQGLVTLKAFHR